MGLLFRRSAFINWLLFFACVGTGLLLGGMELTWAAAQGSSKNAYTATLGILDTSHFPSITTDLDVRNSQGDFIQGLTPDQVKILEDQRSIPIKTLNETRPGAQFALALSPGFALGVRDGQGITRFDRIINALSSWANAHRSITDDDLSLFIGDGPEASHLSNSIDWLRELESYTADVRTAPPNIEVLSTALEAVSDPTPRPGMGRLLLFITPTPQGNIAAGLAGLAGRAKQSGVRISIWLVANQDNSYSPSATQLQDLAAQTGGKFFIYSGVETLSSLDDYLNPLRFSYSLSYKSFVSTSGTHQVYAEIQTGNSSSASGSFITSTLQSYDVLLKPPSVAFISFPAVINREYTSKTSTGGSGQQNQAGLMPAQQPLAISVEFPDGFIRSVLTSTLFVDGKVYAQNTHPPMDEFKWDLNRYSTSSVHKLKVEAVDELGLRGTTQEIPVQVTVNVPPPRIFLNPYQEMPLLATIGLVTFAGILLFVLVITGRIRPAVLGRGKFPTVKGRDFMLKSVPAVKKSSSSQEKTKPSSTITRPLPETRTELPSRRLPHWITRLQRTQHRSMAQTLAYLDRYSDLDHVEPIAPIPLFSEEITIGSDPSRATLPLESSSIEPLHARLYKEKGTYRIKDEGSTAGTWVNYVAVTKEGIVLEHGDLVHFGRLGFRFSLKYPDHARKPVVRPEDKSS